MSGNDSLREEVFTGKRKTYRPETDRMVQGKQRKKSGRTCRACGRDPWPNMFFCLSCHGVVSKYVFME